jgi:homoserine O-acetyltransferase
MRSWARAIGPSQRKANIGDLRLESGDTIRSCIVGYRTAGRLDAARTNAVLAVPWFQGTSGQIAAQVGPGKLVDTKRFFVVAVDPIGNGVSSSPCQGRAGARRFPAFTMADIVESQYQLLTKVLPIASLRAVVGFSMGGMQVFQWIASHPGFTEKAVSIVGSPQTQPDDRARWEAYIGAQEGRSRWRDALRALARCSPRAAIEDLRARPDNHIAQARAIIGFDAARSYGGSLEQLAASIRTQLLVAGAWTDREVNPHPAFDVARLAGAEILELDGRCGHQAPSCEQTIVWRVVSDFLER